MPPDLALVPAFDEMSRMAGRTPTAAWDRIFSRSIARMTCSAVRADTGVAGNAVGKALKAGAHHREPPPGAGDRNGALDAVGSRCDGWPSHVAAAADRVRINTIRENCGLAGAMKIVSDGDTEWWLWATAASGAASPSWW
jgi:hypothetical protein